jgi:hypothetical protein
MTQAFPDLGRQQHDTVITQHRPEPDSGLSLNLLDFNP